MKANYPAAEAHGIMFHHFHGQSFGKSQGSISAEQFDQMLDFLGGKERLLEPEEWIERSTQGQLQAHHLCLTFDDSLRCQYEIAYPVMQARGLKAFWFVYSSVFQGAIEYLEIFREFRSQGYSSIDDFYADFFRLAETSQYSERVSKLMRAFDPKTYLKGYDFYSDNDRKFRFMRDKALGPEAYNQTMLELMQTKKFDIKAVAQAVWMSSENLKTLAQARSEVGLHSHSHPTVMASLTREEQRQEFGNNFEFLHALLKKQPRAMSHPCGSYNADTLSILKNLGISVGFRSNMAKSEGRSALEIPREDHVTVLKLMETK